MLTESLLKTESKRIASDPLKDQRYETHSLKSGDIEAMIVGDFLHSVQTTEQEVSNANQRTNAAEDEKRVAEAEQERLRTSNTRLKNAYQVIVREVKAVENA